MRFAICFAELVGHKVTSSRSSSSVQRDMGASSVMVAFRLCYTCRSRRYFGDES
jgi:hypothetical protein